ncbi:MAG: transcription antitermination factor NusB [Ruthenibacterium sp.]
MKRRQARENAILAAFEESFHANSIEDIVAMSHDCGEYELDPYGETLLIHFYAHSAEVEDTISEKLKDWTLARLPRVNAAILRMAVTEMMYSAEDMDSIVINEAVEIAKKYAGEGDYQFINGVLGSIARDLHGAAALPAEELALSETLTAAGAQELPASVTATESIDTANSMNGDAPACAEPAEAE